MVLLFLSVVAAPGLAQDGILPEPEPPSCDYTDVPCSNPNKSLQVAFTEREFSDNGDGTNTMLFTLDAAPGSVDISHTVFTFPLGTSVTPCGGGEALEAEKDGSYPYGTLTGVKTGPLASGHSQTYCFVVDHGVEIPKIYVKGCTAWAEDVTVTSCSEAADLFAAQDCADLRSRASVTAPEFRTARSVASRR
jgi:hypothetical protein